MAEIKIQKKQPIWPWILLILGVLALVYYLYQKNNDAIDDVMDDDVEMIRDSTDVTTDMGNKNALLLSDIANSKISEYKSFIANDQKMGVDHEFSSTAIHKLIDATEAVASSFDMDIKSDLESARNTASEITNDPQKVDHAEKIKSAGNAIVQSLKKIQTQKFPDLENNLDALKNSVAAITPTTKTLDQKDVIKDFFNQAAEVLTNMKNN